MTTTSNNKASSSGSSNEASLGASEALAQEMAAALAGAFPRIRISQLEPVQAVARGVWALIEERVSERSVAMRQEVSFLDTQEESIRVLAECLATWQAESMEAKLDQWLGSSDAGFRKISISNPSGKAYDVFLVHVHPGGTRQREWYGHGETPGLALGKALAAFDEEDGDEAQTEATL